MKKAISQRELEEEMEARKEGEEEVTALAEDSNEALLHYVKQAAEDFEGFKEEREQLLDIEQTLALASREIKRLRLKVRAALANTDIVQ